MLTVLSISGYGQCQDQICTFTGGCFKCLQSTGFSCRATSCNACTSMHCTQSATGQQNAAACISYEHLFDHSSINLVAEFKGASRIQFLPLEEKGEPAKLLSFTVKTDGILQHVLIVNNSKKSIIQYRLGWVVGGTSRQAALKLGLNIKLAKPLPMSTKKEVADFLFPSSLFQAPEGVTRVGFFIASVTFSDGSSWHANLKTLKQDATLPATTHEMKM